MDCRLIFFFFFFQLAGEVLKVLMQIEKSTYKYLNMNFVIK